jgi:spermidine/putrescine-binding protein
LVEPVTFADATASGRSPAMLPGDGFVDKTANRKRCRRRVIGAGSRPPGSNRGRKHASRRGFDMIRFWLSLLALLIATPALAEDKLVVSIWGGSWRDLVAETVAKKFTAETGVGVDFVTGGTIDRLNKEKLAKGNPDSDITFTTSHVGWLYANDGLFETLDTAKIPNAKNLADEARISPFHLGAWAYVYTIGYRSDLVKDMKFESWNDLWSADLKAKLAAPDFDPSHIIIVAAMLSGGDAAHWEKGEDKLKSLNPISRPSTPTTPTASNCLRAARRRCRSYCR